MAEKKHTVVDELSKKSATAEEKKQQAKEIDIDDFIEVELNSLKVAPIAVEPSLHHSHAQDGNL